MAPKSGKNQMNTSLQYHGFIAFLLLDEEIASRAVFAIVPGSDMWTGGNAFGVS